jgi:hypothetical protein
MHELLTVNENQTFAFANTVFRKRGTKHRYRDMDVTIENLPAPIIGKADWRQFRSFRLPNGVIACVVHDKESKTTAAAATVNVGAASDPREMPGLARK